MEKISTVLKMRKTYLTTGCFEVVNKNVYLHVRSHKLILLVNSHVCLSVSLIDRLTDHILLLLLFHRTRVYVANDCALAIHFLQLIVIFKSISHPFCNFTVTVGQDSLHRLLVLA